MYTVPQLPYAYNDLEPFIDERTMQIHHDKHHAAYVKNLNDALVGQEKLLSLPVSELIKNLDAVPEAVRTKVRNNGGGHANHSLFWTSMAPVENQEPRTKDLEPRTPNGDLKKVIEKTYGSVEKFQEAFAAAGVGRFGSGWVWLIADHGTLTIEDSPNQDSPVMAGKVPILGLDVWEHAYYLKYQNLRADYIKAWWNVVNWKEVARRFEEVNK